MEIIADFHIHSHYSRATSSECVPEMLDIWARRKGINLLGTGDFTHAGWRNELKEKLVATEDGFYELKKELRNSHIFSSSQMRFVITGEISSIYKKGGRTRKIHNLIIFPSLEDAEKLSLKLEKIGNLHSDGRPIIGLDSKNLLEMTLEICPKALFIPAHIWTPHFSLFGANSGFDELEECFEELTVYIYSLETGLSSDPAMNWRLSKLDRFALTSNSDAHSPANIAREANIFDTDFTYDAIYNAIKNNDKSKFVETLEFFPEEGKYHYDGHRSCKIQWEPSKTIAAGGICPVCGGKLTIGVLHRVEVLADREEGYRPPSARNFIRLTTLQHVIAAALGCSQTANRVIEYYESMIENLGPELSILRKISIEEIKNCVGEIIAEGIKRVREGKLNISAGYDGQYGIIEIFTEAERKELCGQTNFLNILPISKKNKKREKIQLERIEKKEKILGNKTKEPNKEQLKAISSEKNCVIVIAGPGTGKTFTLVNRIIYLVNQKKIEPTDIVAVTFTNKAAKEVYSRLNSLLSQKIVDKITVGTFHSICFNLLCKYINKNFNIADEITSTAILDEIIKKNSLNVKTIDILNEISKIKSRLPNDIEGISDHIKSILKEYQHKLELFSALDFEDIMLKTLEFCKEYPYFSDKNILVDEFQDINSIQYELIKLWKGEKGNLFVIGDPHQSIYGFRGSSYHFFKKLKEDFEDVEEIILKYNYRSTYEIVEAAKCVISKSKDYTYSHTLESTFNEKKEKINIVKLYDEREQGIFIAKKINELIGGIDMIDADIKKRKKRNEDYSFSDICVLFRTNRQSEIIEECLCKEGIPYIVAGKEQLFSSEELLRILTIIKFMVNPSDLLSLVLSLKYAELSIEIANIYASGEHTISKLIEIIKTKEKNEKAKNFIKLLNLISNNIISKNIPNLITEVANLLGIDQNGASIEKLIKIFQSYGDAEIEKIIKELILGREADIIREEKKAQTKECVLLSTLHASKGLEFKAVFIAGVNEGIIPFVNKRFDTIDIEEERRLFYVGITRAQKELFLLYTSGKDINRGTTLPSYSRFIEDIDKKYILFEEYKQRPEAIQLTLF